MLYLAHACAYNDVDACRSKPGRWPTLTQHKINCPCYVANLLEAD